MFFDSVPVDAPASISASHPKTAKSRIDHVARLVDQLNGLNDGARARGERFIVFSRAVEGHFAVAVPHPRGLGIRFWSMTCRLVTRVIVHENLRNLRISANGFTLLMSSGSCFYGVVGLLTNVLDHMNALLSLAKETNPDTNETTRGLQPARSGA